MRTFRDFTELKSVADDINLAASLMTDLEVDPVEWILEWSSNCPALELVLLEDVNNYTESVNRIMEAGPQMAQQTMPGAQPQQQAPGYANAPGFGQTLKQVGSAVGNFFAGPARRFNMAQSALVWLKKKIDSLPNAADLKTTKNYSLSKWLELVIKELTSQAQQIPALIQRYEQGQTGQQQQQQPQPQQQQP